MMPGRTLHRLAGYICCAQTLERIVEPAIADLQKEYAESGATASQRMWTLVTGYAAIINVTAMCAFSVSIASDDDRRTIIRIMAWFVALTVAFTGLLMLPPLSIVEASISSMFLAALIPQAVPLAIPIGLTFGIAVGVAGRTATRRITTVILLTALIASLVSFVTLAWVMPAGNQAYRESIAQAVGLKGQLTKGLNEMTLSELNRQAAIASAAGNTRDADAYAWSYHLRFALSVASVVLAGVLFATGVRSMAVRALLALTACFAYWVLLNVGEGFAVFSPVAPAFAGTIPSVLGAWLPKIILAALAMVLASSRAVSRTVRLKPDTTY